MITRTRTIVARTRNANRIHGTGAASVHALRNVSVDFADGEFVAIMGPSGSGKSTLLHCMAGLDRLSSGHTYIGESELTSLSEAERTRLRSESIGFIFQSFNLVPTFNVIENVCLPMHLSGRTVHVAWMEHLLELVGLQDRIEHLPLELSGGEQQRVAVVRALVSKPKIVFADEPTGNLDTARGAEILDFIRMAVDELERTVVMVTHDPAAACQADRVLFFADGRIIEEAIEPTADQIFETMKALRL